MTTSWNTRTIPITSYGIRTIPNTSWGVRPETNTYIIYNQDISYNINYKYEEVIAGTPWNTRIIP